MKEGFVISENPTVSENELELINKFTRRFIKENEVYVFSVVLCDNDIDREFECFTDESLEKLSNLFVGKTGIMDHEAKSEKQAARIFSCTIEHVKERKNALGKNYLRLVARAYIPRSKANEEIILAIDSGIKKEVSIRCSISEFTCSICGADIRSCSHIKGRKYKNLLCHTILQNPIDAYEWSFVAIPAQREAGVIKAFDEAAKGGDELENSIKSFLSGGFAKTSKIAKHLEISADSFGNSQEFEIFKKIAVLKEEALIGRVYLDEIKSEISKLFAMVEPESNGVFVKKVIENFDFQGLKAFKEDLKIKAKKLFPSGPQLFCEENKNSGEYSEFKI
ncbi:MAG: hypothetical protein LBP36_03925 [Oscillospiraceae bacterium]|jgi:hypothetical protein|nr:hypothetical protein [Oscillospiraceae bacterium]